MGEKKMTRRSCSHDAPKTRISQDTVTDQIIAQDFDHGTLIAAIVMALCFGAAMLMWAVV